MNTFPRFIWILALAGTSILCGLILLLGWMEGVLEESVFSRQSRTRHTMTMLRLLILAILLLPATAHAQHTIQASGDRFVPDTLHAQVGDIIVFEPGSSNHVAHVLGGETYPVMPGTPEPRRRFVPQQPGEIIYVCTLHVEQGMWGVIVVEERSND